MFHARDVRTGKLSTAHCVNGLVPLILGDLPAALVGSLLAQARSPRFGLAESGGLPLPSYDRTAPDFDRLRYWRGPVWININWLLWRGLRSHGQGALAAALRGSMLRLVEQAGCFEYFDPVTGAGIGSPAFSWTAALALDLLAEG
jgi:neutral trehalase